MKIKELKLMNEADMGNRMADLKKELMKLNSQIAIGMSPKNPSKAREIKRTIAKILTLKQEKAKQKTEVSKRNE